MHEMYNEFVKLLDAENKAGCVEFILSKLRTGEVDILTLYTKVLEPSLSQMACRDGEKFCIWREHVRTSIVRTILECCYPFMIEEMKRKGVKARDKKVIVVCPAEEYHEIGARMASDFFTLCGWDAVFVGTNTPRDEIIGALSEIKPAYIAISVTSPYNLLAAKRTIELVRKECDCERTKIIVGGQAFLHNREAYLRVGADMEVQTFEDICRLERIETSSGPDESRNGAEIPGKGGEKTEKNRGMVGKGTKKGAGE